MQIKMKNVQVGDTVIKPVFGKVTKVTTRKPNTFPADELAQIDFGVGSSPLAGFAGQMVEIAQKQVLEYTVEDDDGEVIGVFGADSEAHEFANRPENAQAGNWPAIVVSRPKK
jgi:hypothetical protein